ncbi:MAG: DNA-3-methyladenine glycosylase [Pseudanabaena sp. ELA607]
MSSDFPDHNQLLRNKLSLNKLPRDFYLQNTFKVAQNLLGTYLCTQINHQITAGKIVETEAYIGAIDYAAHSYPNKRTKRTAIQFGLGGYAYIFLIYGMYPQFCVVTEDYNICNVVLIRALEPIIGMEVMQERRKINSKKGTSQGVIQTKQIANGPGKLCIALGITTAMYGSDLCGAPIWLSAATEPVADALIMATPRIGIDYAGEFALKPWRFYLDGNDYVSRQHGAAIPLNWLSSDAFEIEDAN